MKLLRTLRLDRSDTFVFERAAAAGEWAVPGGFMFWDEEPTQLAGKPRAAFRSGFLGLSSFGFATLVEVVEASEADHEAAISSLARRLCDEHGAPDLATARAAAAEEISFAQSLCEPAAGTVIALQRSIEADGEVRERFRTLTPTLQPDGNSFAQGCVMPIGVAREDGETPAEEPDLVAMLGGAAAKEPAP